MPVLGVVVSLALTIVTLALQAEVALLTGPFFCQVLKTLEPTFRVYVWL